MNNVRVRTVLLQGHLLEFHRSTRAEHLLVVGLKRGGLLRRKYFVVPFTLNLFSADAEGSFEFFVDVQVAAFNVFEKVQAGAVIPKGVKSLLAFMQRPFGSLALRDVTDDACKKDAFARPPACQRQLQREFSPVFSSSGQLDCLRSRDVA